MAAQLVLDTQMKGLDPLSWKVSNEALKRVMVVSTSFCDGRVARC